MRHTNCQNKQNACFRPNCKVSILAWQLYRTLGIVIVERATKINIDPILVCQGPVSKGMGVTKSGMGQMSMGLAYHPGICSDILKSN